MVEKAGSRVELSTWPTTLVLEAPADDGQAAALVVHDTGEVLEMRREGDRWTLSVDDVASTADVVVYRADDPHSGPGPDEWTATISNRTFRIEKSDRSHTAAILMTLYRRDGRRLAKIAGDGYAFGIDAYARSRGIDRASFARIRRRASVPAQPAPRARPVPEAGPLRGQGSGVSVADGLVVTNHHVVAGVDRLVVVHEGRRADAYVVCGDAEHDVALVRHSLDGLGEVPQRDAAESHLGEEILAAGFPLAEVLGDDLKLTYGNVSGLRGGGDVTRIQFTAAIASGSSGGALLDMSGRLVGLVSAALRHSAFADRGAASENVNFAVKASVVREMLVAAGRPASALVGPSPLGRVELARLARRCVVSIDCFGR
jgi:S1-C subfamily serine protease